MNEDLLAQLQFAAEIDPALSGAITDEVISLPAVEVGALTIVLPGDLRLLENLWLARRTHSAVARLMFRTTEPTNEDDLTEPAAILSRHLQELLLQVGWLTEYEPPDDLKLPAPVGDGEALHAIAHSDWDGEDLRGFVGYLIHSTSWIDVQALRSELGDINQQRLLHEASADWDASDSSRHAMSLEILADRAAMTEARLVEIGAPTSPREGYIDIARKMGDEYVITYRMESDTAHAGEMGRRYQRGSEGDPALGAPSPPERQAYVMTSANAALLELAGRVLRKLDGDPEPLNELARRYYDEQP